MKTIISNSKLHIVTAYILHDMACKLHTKIHISFLKARVKLKKFKLNSTSEVVIYLGQRD